MLTAIGDRIAVALPTFVVKVGYWAREPNVSSVYLSLGREDYAPRERKLTLHIDLFHRAAAGTDDASCYRELELYQQQIEDESLDWLQQQTGVIVAEIKSWEQSGGAFVPTYGSRLTLTVTDIYARRVAVSQSPMSTLTNGARSRYLHIAGHSPVEVGDPDGNL
ncbi:MAG: hypothetical protein BWK73_04605 [Thiothrix lacustris]|uniref:Uncharacterized protein n=1 Tax=Thiothrix lacustris TaxID=525917 RepID=A0A1Y1QXJ0_9GAMM|nr:MAG: hypothetical protein BWK73_04605 [Thiothrix lacustris]